MSMKQLIERVSSPMHGKKDMDFPKQGFGGGGGGSKKPPSGYGAGGGGGDGDKYKAVVAHLKAAISASKDVMTGKTASSFEAAVTMLISAMENSGSN
jgi:hypothetical protein